MWVDAVANASTPSAAGSLFGRPAADGPSPFVVTSMLVV
jgi:hypothetical protein